MEAQHVAVFNGVGDGVGVQLLLEDVRRGLVGRLLAFNLLSAGVLLEDRRAGKAEQLGVGKKRLDSLMVVAELRAMAFVEDEDDALVAQWFQPLLVVFLVGTIQRQAELLDGGDDDLVGIVVREQAAHQGLGVGVLLDTAFLELVEFLARLPVEVFAVHHEQAFVDVRVVLEQRGGLERGKRLTAAGGVPDVAVAAVLVDTIDNRLDGVDLIRPHHQELLLAGHQHHVAADHFAQRAFGKKGVGKAVQMGDLAVVHVRELVQRQEAFVGVEAEVAAVVVGEIPGVAAVADDEQLQEAEQGFAVAVAGCVLIIDDLLHGPARADLQGFQLDLNDGNAVDEQDHIVTVMAVIGADAQLINHLEAVFAPVLEVDQRIVKRRAVITFKTVALAQMFGSGEHVWGDDRIQQAMELIAGEADAVERLELFAKVGLKLSPITDIGTVAVFEITQLVD
ncbi:hypothetical protein NSMM_160027 [Nitrosomonas mobilis]|uniref:Uncharacterized protein n=1 Tax=Nitrosomonas mobilis TaxID=51642 RepID=A0A1G5SBS7_9PROT|nr:hypothetical protein NSMM_160027 [Nitrosomonas mobilis]